MPEITVTMNGRLYRVSSPRGFCSRETLVEVWIAETTRRDGQHRHGHWRRVRDMGYDQDMRQRAIDRAISSLGNKSSAATDGTAKP